MTATTIIPFDQQRSHQGFRGDLAKVETLHLWPAKMMDCMK